jgi:hypothetical protein
MLPREPAAMVDEFCSASPETAMRLINSRRFVVIRLYRSVLEPASRHRLHDAMSPAVERSGGLEHGGAWTKLWQGNASGAI